LDLHADRATARRILEAHPVLADATHAISNDLFNDISSMPSLVRPGRAGTYYSMGSLSDEDIDDDESPQVNRASFEPVLLVELINNNILNKVVESS